MKVCPQCQTQMDDAAAFCDNCGHSFGAGAVPGAPPPVAPPPAYPAPVPGGGGVACPSCGTQNMPGTMFCDNCGVSLGGIAPPPGGVAFPPTPPPYAPFTPAPGVPPTPGFPPAPGFPPPGAPPVMPGVPPAPVVGVPPSMPARLMIGGQQVVVPQKAEAVIGRADLASGWNPDVDLTPFGGTPEAGVSRKHAKLVWQGAWMIEDLNSVNGTYMHGQRLAPGQRTPVNNGDVIQMGKLQLTFYAS